MKPRRRDWPPELTGGGLSCLIGTAIMLISFLDPRDDAFPEGRPVVLVAGLVFFLAGVAILVPALARGRDTTLLLASRPLLVRPAGTHVDRPDVELR